MEITQIITIIATVVLAAVFGGILALFSYFIDYCLWENSIFSDYLPRLARFNLRLFKPAELRSLNSAKEAAEYDNHCIEAAVNTFFYKILGGCSICTNIWLGLITFGLFHNYLGLSWPYLLPYVLFASYVLRRILK